VATPTSSAASLGYEPRRTKSGASATAANGAHVANRVGHVQGGLL
jgi:hypothetical protein